MLKGEPLLEWSNTVMKTHRMLPKGRCCKFLLGGRLPKATQLCVIGRAMQIASKQMKLYIVCTKHTFFIVYGSFLCQQAIQAAHCIRVRGS